MAFEQLEKQFGTKCKELIEIWKRYPSLAAKDLLYNPLSSNPDENFSLSPIQRVVTNRIWHARNSITVACRGFGKTFDAATMGILSALLNPGRRVGCMSASFRQAKQIFEEVSNIWNRSPLLQACTDRAPVIANDACTLVFKAVPGHNPSKMIGLPLADGQKVRGARMHTLMLDEVCVIPENTFQTVLRPFAATSMEPTKQTRLAKERRRIMGLNLSEDKKQEMLDLLSGRSSVNQIHMFTSGYYSFNWVYNLYCKYSDRMHGIKRGAIDGLDDGYTDNPLHYATFQIPYWSLEEGWLSEGGLSDARRDMSSIQFRMEYEAAWISDSGGFFKISDIEQCRAENLGIDLQMRPYGDPGRQYIMTLDPARTSDAFAIVISEVDPTFGLKISHMEQHFKVPTPKIVERILQLTSKFNIVEIGMDRGGGGQTVADYLAHGNVEFSPIFDKDDERYRGMRGRHILQLIDFSPTWIENANHNANFLLERRKVAFPKRPMEGASSSSKLDELDRNVKIVEQLIMQLISIQISETRTGKAHFDLPETGGGFVKHKDLYSAFIMACDLVYNKIQSSLLPTVNMPLLGIITPRMNMGGGYY